MHWTKVKDMIEKDLDRIFWEEPIEVTMCKKGIYPKEGEKGDCQESAHEDERHGGAKVPI